MRQTVNNYAVLSELNSTTSIPLGESSSPKGVIFHILENPAEPVEVLDIGFGTGGLGRLIKSSNEYQNWSVDGIDGWESNCHNKESSLQNFLNPHERW